jgi:hypothetical protein
VGDVTEIEDEIDMLKQLQIARHEASFFAVARQIAAAV